MGRALRECGGRPSVVLLVCLAVIANAGCGARTGLVESQETDGGRPESGAGGRPESEDGGTPRTCADWMPLAGAPTQLSRGDGYHSAKVSGEGDRVFVTLNAADGRGDLRVVSSDLSDIGPVRTVFEGGGIVGVASGFGHRGAVGAQPIGDLSNQRCEFVALADDGSPVGPRSTVAPTCLVIAATPSGYAMLTYDAPALPPGSDVEVHVCPVLLDAAGAVLEVKPCWPSSGPAFLGAMDDGSLLAVWVTTEGDWLQRLDAAAEPLAEPQQLSLEPVNIAAAVTGSSGLVALLGIDGDEVDVWAIDQRDLLARKVSSAPSPDFALDLTLAAAPHGALVVWTTVPSPSHNAEDLRVWGQPITTEGEIAGDPFDLTQDPWPNPFVRAVGTPGGALLAYVQEYHDGGVNQAFARALCHE